MTTINDDVRIVGSLQSAEYIGKLDDAIMSSIVASIEKTITDTVDPLRECVAKLTETLSAQTERIDKLTEAYNAAIGVINDLSERVAALEKHYDPTLI